ncbi:hypothetical protein KIW84_055268 [Lathyrus oleraceus]|uniref:Pentatricopeptide repeat-containing protein n=1 Tax=Pisum sativum TaxID=3888 RepID=A0A9D5AFL3_PEA|nr:hypothetical protein KIW84_055268 [Pisum sativum]
MSHRNIIPWNTVIVGYLHNNMVEQANKLFDMIPGRDNFPWALMVTCYTRKGKLVKDLVSYNSMLAGYTQNRKLSLAMRLALYSLPGGASQEAKDNDQVLEENQPTETNVGSIRGPTQFMFETEVDRIFSTPLGSTLMFASHGNQIGLVKLIQGYNLSTSTANVLVGALNDKLLLASLTEINPRQKKGVEIKSFLVGLLEPILIGVATMQRSFEQKLDLS